MKIVKFRIEDFVIKSGVATPVKETFFVTLPHTEASEKWAKKHAYDGKIEILEIEDPAAVPTQLDIIEAQVTYTAMMTDTLLEV